ncbi:MAG TPA: BTAD domain-containing putative transcriptional regulator [Pseudonocardiaceae bacterium]|nr:BTAD domain-containing putative transcriptional regulator [Pseudonocardiaceae bacterium]
MAGELVRSPAAEPATVLVLGPVVVRQAGRLIAPSAPLTRAIIGVLALAGPAGESVATLAEAAWPRRRSAADDSAVLVAVHRTRRWLAGSVGPGVGIERYANGYRLTGAQVDAEQFVRLAAEEDRLADALALWRGEPLADVTVNPPVTGAIEALHRARSEAATRYGRALLRAGRPGVAVTTLAPLADAHPLDEPLHAVLIEALAAAGRQADALDRYERLRGRLADELGVDPGRDLSDALVKVLRQDVRATRRDRGAAGRSVPRQLPPDVRGFTGRTAQLAELHGLIRDGRVGSVSISALSGVGGVGKTALAVHWSHQVASSFPDGQLYLDLRGHAADPPLSAAEALARLLPALGVAANRVPVDLDEAAALYRTTLAGKRVLIVLDNAAGTGQVRPLLPGIPASLVVVTSRNRLDGLAVREGTFQLTVPVFAPDESLSALTAVLGAARVDAEPEAAAELADLCGHLPLALRIAAAYLAANPGMPLADHVGVLRANRLAALAVPDDPLSSVRAVFELSDRRLSDVDRRVLRLLGVAPGVDITAPAAAALCDMSEVDAEAALLRLAAAHLLVRTDDRYSWHDLVRAYARERAELDCPANERANAVDRLCHWYVGMARAAAVRLFPHDPQPDLPFAATPTGFDSDERAAAWLPAELDGLMAVVEHAAEHGPAAVAWLLCAATYRCARNSNPRGWLRAARAARAAALVAGDPLGVAVAEHATAGAYTSRGALAKAAEHLTGMLPAARRAGWADGIALALTCLGTTAIDAGDTEAAARHLTEAIEFSRAHGLTGREMAAANNLAHLYDEIGEPRRAADHQGRAVEYFRRVGDHTRLWMAVDGYATFRHHMGDLAGALALFDEVEPHLAAIGRRPLCWLLTHKAEVYTDLGQHVEARRLAGQVLAMAELAGLDAMHTRGLVALARAELRADRVDEAIRLFDRAIPATRQVGLGKEEIEALTGLARAAHASGDDDAALTSGQQALAVADRHHYALDAAEASTVLAAIHLARGDTADAADLAEQAVVVCEERGARLAHARALHVLGAVRQAQQRPADAAVAWRAACDLFAEIGAPEADTLRDLAA